MSQPTQNAACAKSQETQKALKKYYTFGLSLLQLMFVLGGIGLLIVAVYEYLL